jgi:hypothetical protein
MPDDEIVAEIRKWREEYAKRFNYDLKAIFEDLRKKQRSSGSKVVSLAPKRVAVSPKKTPNEPVSLARRLAKLEAEVAKLNARLDAIEKAPKWWERIAGTFRNDPVYEEAMRLGRQYRESQRPKAKRRKNKRSAAKK